MMNDIFLDDRELAQADALGEARAAIWDPEMIAALDPYSLSRAEFAAAKAFNLHEPTDVNGPHTWNHVRGPMQIRCSTGAYRGFIVFDDDPEDLVYVVIEERAVGGPYTMIGWLDGSTVRDSRYRRVV
jgi:hypothetical protein